MNTAKKTIEQQLAESVSLLTTYSLQQAKLRKAHVKASFSTMTTDEKARYAKALKNEGLTQNEIASELGVKQPTISNYLKRS